MALEFFIKNLCIEIQQECKSKDIECHQNFMTYYLTLLAYDPLWNLYPKMKEIIREDALRLINFAVIKMRNQICPCIIALKLQFYFHCNFESKHEIVAVNNHNFNIRLHPLVEEILESKPETEVEYNWLLRLMIFYTTLWRGLGNPTNELVYKECYHATISFLDNSDLETFVIDKTEEKTLQLNEVAKITAGIRIFNWTCKKGGHGIEDLPAVLKQKLENFKAHLSERLQDIMDKIDILTSAIDYCFIIEDVEVFRGQGTCIEHRQSCELPDGIEYEEIEFFKDMIIVYRQIEGFLRLLLQCQDHMQITFEELGEQFQECLDRFHALAHIKAGVPTRIIFPLFVELDNIWEAYQDERVYLKRIYQIMFDLDLYIKDFHINYAKLEYIIDDRRILCDADRCVTIEPENCFDEEMFEVDVILPTSIQFKIDEIHFELLGFDLWRLVESQGALIPGNPNFGIVVFEDKYYAFSCKASAFMFAKYPTRYVNEMLELARKKVELIPLLQLHDDLSEVQTLKELVSTTSVGQSNIATTTASMQTEAHAVSRGIDPKYKWNIWDLKRQALQLCDLSHAASKATMTESTHGITSSATQTYAPKEVALQTHKDNYTNTHTLQTYFFGLRGRKDDKQFILDLTRPPDKT